MNKFFTESLPNFMEANCYVIESVLLALFLIFVVLFIVVCINKKREMKLAKVDSNYYKTMSINKDIEIKEKSKSIADLETKLQHYNESIEPELSAKISELENKLSDLEKHKTEIEHAFIDADEKSKDLEKRLSVAVENGKYKDEEIIKLNGTIAVRLDAENKLKISLDEKSEENETLNNEIDKLSIEITNLKQKVDSLLTTNSELNEKIHSVEAESNKISSELNLTKLELENKKAELKDANDEIDELKDLDVENKVLIKTIRRLSKNEDNIKDKLNSFEKFFNKEEEKPDPEVLNEATSQIVDPEAPPKRSEIFAMAKEAGLRDYALMSNKELLEAIEKAKSEKKE